MAARRSLVAVVALALASGCTNETSDAVSGDDPVGDTVATGQSTGDDLADQSHEELSGDDYLIVIGKTASILGALNDGEIEQALFAVQVVNDAAHEDFAADLIADHSAANADLDSTIRFYGVGYIPSNTALSVTLEADAGLGQLRAASPADIDFVFADVQVRMHAAAQVMLDELYTIVGPGEMGDTILEAEDMANKNLARASQLLSTHF